MPSRLTLAVALVATCAVATTPALAAKPKPKPIKGSYSVTLYPDPTPDVSGEAGKDMNCGPNPKSTDLHAFTVPAAGTLQVNLENAAGPTPSGDLLWDWDLFLLDSGGQTIDASISPGGSEAMKTKFKGKQAVQIQVCNLTGTTSGTVSYTFTYA